MELVPLGFLTALGFFILMWKINMDFFAKYHWQTDIAFTGIGTFLFYGTFSGMAVAVIAGIFLSIFLYIARLFRGF